MNKSILSVPKSDHVRLDHQAVRGRPLLCGLVGLAMLFWGTTVFAQTAPIPHRIVPFQAESGVFDGRPESGTVRMYTESIQTKGAPWTRVHFRAANLGKGSYITVRSKRDGASQRLDAKSLRQWRNWSAYFNGDTIDIALHVGGNDRRVSLSVDRVMVGTQGLLAETRCGPNDDRVSSADPAVARLLPVGCTAWLVSDGSFVTAGHCLASAALLGVVQFNVPPSLSDGTPQHPDPDDQYTVNVPSRKWRDDGPGNDWGVFEAFPNENTGLTPLSAQNAFFAVKQDLGPANIRITGYGVDAGVDNQTQQTHVGPNAGSSGTTMEYQTDTEGGNSGSPIIDEATGQAVGVHTHGGCTTSDPPGGSNAGTSFFNTKFWNALNPPCPAEAALQGGSESAVELSSLRRFRDEMLATHATTKTYINLFNRHAPEITLILISNAKLRQRTARLLRELLPGIQELTNGESNGFVLTSGRVWRIKSLLRALGAKGRGALRKDLNQLAKLTQSWRNLSLQEVLETEMIKAK